MRMERVMFESGCRRGETACRAMMRLHVGKVKVSQCLPINNLPFSVIIISFVSNFHGGAV